MWLGASTTTPNSERWIQGVLVLALKKVWRIWLRDFARSSRTMSNLSGRSPQALGEIRTTKTKSMAPKQSSYTAIVGSVSQPDQTMNVVSVRAP